jgi:YbbR domain-containing protein
VISPRKIFFHNFWLKLFSLMLALMIWFAVFSIQDKPKAVPGFGVGDVKKAFDQVPVSVMKSPNDTALYTISPNAVNIVVTGDPAVLAKLTARDVQVFIDLTDSRAGARKNERKQDIQVRLPELVDKIEVSPSYVFADRITP